MRATAVLLLLAAAGCASAAPPAAPPPTPATQAPPATTAATPAVPAAIRWVRNSAEHRGLYLQIFRSAGEKLTELARGRAPGSWGVILDADETVLDNSEFERRMAASGQAYSEAAWQVWVREESAPALPGAVDFLRQIHALGGRVVIVTGRVEAVCPETRENLAKDSLVADLVLCQTTTSDKNPRFQAVQAGTASPGMPRLDVVMWLGDNIQDFPGLGQQVRQQPDSAYARFGRDFFLLPNPLYGSWEKNPE